MRHIALTMLLMLGVGVHGHSVEFLGIDLCKGAVNTAVVLPEGSPLTIESVELGSRGDLVILLAAKGSNALSLVDDLMEGYTGGRGTGNKKSLQWSGRKITAYGKEITAKYVALAVSTSDDCSSDEPRASAAPAADAPQADTTVEIQDAPTEAAMVAAAAAASAPQPHEAEPETAIPSPAADPDVADVDFELMGRLKHESVEAGWVDVMGVVANRTEESYRLATFDLSFYDGAGDLICVDTISVSVVKPGQERAFRDSIRCPDYTPEAVSQVKLQFAGGQ